MFEIGFKNEVDSIEEKGRIFQQSNGQLALFQPDFIRDADCTKETPVIYGKSDIPIYGTGKEFTHEFLEGKTQSI